MVQDMRLLERDAQVEALGAALRAAATGEGAVALVSGEAGIGKTALVEYFLREKDKSWRVLRGACDSLFTPRPLGPLYDIALQTGGVLLELLEAESRQSAIFTACLAEIRKTPTILLIEDVHWADEATLDLLQYLARRSGQSGSLVILTYRDDELGAGHPLRRVLGDLASFKWVYRIPVPSLSREAVGQLAGKGRVDAAELHRLTNGNPFFVTEVLAAGEAGIPATVRDAVLARAARLSAPARSFLEAAAVIGLRSEARLLAQVSSSESAAVDECVAAGMLRADADHYTFRHELARQTILESILPQRRAELHKRTLAALQDSPDKRQDLTRLANHAQGSGEPQAVLKYAPAAARQAAILNAHRQAVALYELALQFQESLSTADRARMLDDYAAELWFAGRIADSLIALERAAKLWHVAGDRLREGADVVQVAETWYSQAQSAKGAQAGELAIAILEPLGPSAELAQAYRAQCFIAMERRDAPQALAWGGKALELAERFGDQESQARVCNYMGCALMVREYERGRNLMERSLRLAREAESTFAISGTLANWAQILLEIWQLADAVHYLDEGIPFATERDDHYHLQLMLAWQAQLRLQQGRWPESLEIVTNLLRAPNLDNPSYAYSAGLVTLGRLLTRRGQEGATARLDESLALSIQGDAVVRIGSARAVRAEAAWLAGDHATAIVEARSAYEMAVARGHPWLAGELAFWSWRAGAQVHPPEWIARPFALQIDGDWRGAGREWEKRGGPYEQAMALFDGDEAAQLAALDIFQRLGARPAAEKLKRKMRAEGVRAIPRGPRPSTRANVFGLTTRELEVISRLVEGASNSEIARHLNLSTRTVEHHIASILQKMGVESRSEAVAQAVKAGLAE